MRGKAVQHKMKVAPFSQHEQVLISKIRVLPPERLMEVEDFIDFLRQASEDRQLRQAAAKLSEDAFGKVWDNPEDAEYDRL
jgi:hypothetical protein